MGGVKCRFFRNFARQMVGNMTFEHDFPHPFDTRTCIFIKILFISHHVHILLITVVPAVRT